MKQKARAFAARFHPILEVAKIAYQNRKVEVSIAASLAALVRSFVH